MSKMKLKTHAFGRKINSKEDRDKLIIRLKKEIEKMEYRSVGWYHDKYLLRQLLFEKELLRIFDEDIDLFTGVDGYQVFEGWFLEAHKNVDRKWKNG